jgi:thymidine phosphorylase
MRRKSGQDERQGSGLYGGTIDKLESIPGYKTELSPSKFFETVRTVGAAVAGQSANLALADKKLYAIRDSPQRSKAYRLSLRPS